MDLVWKTAEWNAKQTKPPAFVYRKGEPTYAAQMSKQLGKDTPKFQKATHSRSLTTEDEWKDWLSSVPQPTDTAVEASLSLIICPRHPDPILNGKPKHNPATLKYLSIPSEPTFRSLLGTFHVHQCLATVANRGWATILTSTDTTSDPTHPKTHYTLRTTNTLERDTALSLTYIPSKRLTYALFLGYTPTQAETILERLAFSEHAALEPFTLINAFIQLEKVHRFEQFQRHADAMADLVGNFRLGAVAAKKYGPIMSEDDPRNLVGLGAEVTMLRDCMLTWVRELERFREGGEFGAATVDGKPVLDARGYLLRTVDEYEVVVRQCDGLREMVGTTFQMETSSIAKQEVNKMKALAILTMVFLPATFVATFMSMGLFEWHPDEGESVLSPWWYIYFIVAGALTAVVLLSYFFWTWMTNAIVRNLENEKEERHIV